MKEEVKMTSFARILSAVLVFVVVLGFIAFTLYIIPSSQLESLNKEIVISELRKQEITAETARLEAVIAVLNDTLSKELIAAKNKTDSSTISQAVPPQPPAQPPVQIIQPVTRAS
jgi:hypothetical protein